ncbi:BspA family leucine-rich repeat surface protein [Lactiplantibacillus plantarum]|uniref:BspA family leucine-rich repeat surface protein n=1 Tax=Lactiplantibacillus plantarum TaxID=1590 RepID=UPI0013E08E70|nr:BspA family leucine-rich repeat surface protein [Lactiplantibacillus plantarum]MDI5785067.1 BspA family leucine-rich repeat surface protein [Lactiplantibacillus plantarum]NGM26379.1 BspA family leucine-rich repeat surface protein [Lactiplantibacillus plantarum]
MRRICKVLMVIISIILGSSAPLNMAIPPLLALAAPDTSSSSTMSSSAISKVTDTNVMAVSADVTSTTDTSDTSSSDSTSATSTTTGNDTTETADTAVESGTVGTVAWTIDDAGVLTLSGGSFADLTGKRSPWYDYASSITNIKITDEITVTTASNYGYLFASLANVATVTGLNKLSMSGVTSTQSMFYRDSKLTSVDFGQTDFSTVTTMESMFEGCSVLTKVNTTNWNVSHVKSFKRTFYMCGKLTMLDVSNWDVTQVTNLDSTFSGCSSLPELDVSRWNTANVTTLASTFYSCSSVKIINASGWDTARVTDMTATFMNCTLATELNVSGWDTSKVTDMSFLFGGCSSLTTLNLEKWDTGSVTTLYSTFYNCSGLTSLLVDTWDTSKVTNCFWTFGGCSSLTTLNLRSWNLQSATASYGNFFNGSKKLQHLTLGPNFTFHNDKTMYLPEPSKQLPYNGTWQRNNDDPTYTSAKLMTNYDGATMAGTYNWVKTSGTVLVKYVDGDGVEIADEETSSGTSGDAYQTTAKTIDGYTLHATPTNATGTYDASTITVTYVYDGNLFFNSSPTMLDFGSHTISGTTETYAPTLDKTLAVQNNGQISSTWNLTAELDSSGFVGADTGKMLLATLYYQTDDGKMTLSPGVAVQVYSQTTTDHKSVDISEHWSSNLGLLLEVPNGAAMADTYQGTISWRLNNTVANN